MNWREQLRGLPGVEQVVAFGNTLHVSGRDAAQLQLEPRIRAALPAPSRWQPIESGLEDVFISLMETARRTTSLSHEPASLQPPPVLGHRRRRSSSRCGGTG